MIRVERLNFSVGAFALEDVSLDVAGGEYFVLLGPSGSGKTLLLECLCGLNRVDSGRIVIGNIDVTSREPRDRNVGYLPQDYALFPHMTVRNNVGFGLNSLLTLLTGAHRERVNELMKLAGVAHLANRLPRNLSGGEKQRVALARALAIRPVALLLDEPVSALDEQTRDELCRQLKHLQRDTRTTTLHVCHNFAEMLYVADRVAVIDRGRIVQVGTPGEILERPRSLFVARFVQGGNLFSARARPDGQWLRLICPSGVAFRAPLSSVRFDGDVTVMVRPENVHIQTDRTGNMPSGSTFLQGSVSHLADVGPLVRVTVACSGESEFLVSLSKREYNDLSITIGGPVHLAVAPEDVHVMEKGSSNIEQGISK